MASDQQSFQIETCDGKSVTVKLKMPIRDMLSDVLEIYGSVDEKGNIHCVNYATFEQAAYENFGKKY